MISFNPFEITVGRWYRFHLSDKKKKKKKVKHLAPNHLSLNWRGQNLNPSVSDPKTYNLQD